MPKFYALLIVFLFMNSVALIAQNKRISDSLENKVLTAAKDTNLVKLLIETGISHQQNETAKAVGYFNRALTLANQLNFIDGQISANINLGICYLENSKWEKSLFYFKQTEGLLKKYTREFMLTKVYNNFGNLYSGWEKMDIAIEYYNKSIEYGLRYGNRRAVAVTYSNLGGTYIQQGNLVLATSYLLKGLGIREELKDERGIANVSTNLAVLFKELKKYDDAILYGKSAAFYYKKLGLAVDEAKVYVNLGLVANRKKNYPEAEKYFDDALKIFKDQRYNKGIAAVYQNRGNTLKNSGKIEEAKLNYTASYDLSVETGNNEGQAVSLIELGSLSSKSKDYPKAEISLNKALDIAKQYKYLNLEKEANEALVEMYMLKDEYKQAFNYNITAVQLKDSMLAVDKIKIIEDVKGKYETEKKELKIVVLSKSDSIKSLQIQNQQISIFDNLLKISNQKLALSKAALVMNENNLLLKENDLQLRENDLVIKNKEEIILKNRLDAQEKEQRIALLAKEKKIKELEVNKKNIAIVAISLFSVLLSFAGYNFYRKKQGENKLLLQQEVIKQQDLATKGILEAEEKERQRIARDLHDGVGQVMSAAKMNLSAFENEIIFKDENQRLSFERVIGLIDEGCKEVRSVSHQMMPNALLKAGLASAIKEFIDKIDTRILKVNLYSDGLNERIDNNIEIVLYRIIQECVNNVIKHSGANQLDISLIKDKDGLSVTIEDNGKGFLMTDKMKFEGIGLKNIYSRIDFLKGSIDVDSSIGKGTLVAINIPVG